MKIRWSGCLVSVLGLLLLIPLVYYGGIFLIFSIFNDSNGKGGVDYSYLAVLVDTLGLCVVATLFFGGIYRMFKGKPPEAEPSFRARGKADDAPPRR